MKQTEREMSTALLLLRVSQLCIHISDLDLLTVGMISDMFTEAANDEEEWPELADQDDMDKF